MDPNETLKQIRYNLAKLDSEDMSLIDREPYLFGLYVRIQSLDEWLSKGGFLPDDWTHIK